VAGQLLDQAGRVIVPTVVRDAAHQVRRLRGWVQLRDVDATGRAPAAVVAALRHAAGGRPSADERAWIDRIELLRRLLASSPQPLEIVDFGAGPRSALHEDGAERVVCRTLAEMTMSSKPPRWAYLLFRLVRELRPSAVLELGACVGVSASYQAAALELNGSGRLVSLEGSPVLASRSTRSLEELGLGHRATVVEGRFTDTIDTAIADLAPVEMAFVDGHHVEAATLDYMERILAACGDEAVLVFDDIHWTPGMTRAWRAVEDDPRFALTVDLGAVGIAAVSASATERARHTISFG
jgi:predicted O-methyltransferase YrrM